MLNTYNHLHMGLTQTYKNYPYSVFMEATVGSQHLAVSKLPKHKVQKKYNLLKQLKLVILVLFQTYQGGKLLE